MFAFYSSRSSDKRWYFEHQSISVDIFGDILGAVIFWYRTGRNYDINKNQTINPSITDSNCENSLENGENFAEAVTKTRIFFGPCWIAIQNLEKNSNQCEE